MTDETLLKNTPDQVAAHKAAEAAWEEERGWPLYRVVITGDDALWVARPGQNIADKDTQVKLKMNGEVVFDELVKEGDPKPWISPHKATVTLHAKSEDMARARALGHNPECHTIESVEEIEE